jgi:membrane-associated phospholipid phosphatase
MISRGVLLASFLACAASTCGTAAAQTAPSAPSPDAPQTLPPPPPPPEPTASSPRSPLLDDIVAYYTAPLSWSARDWEFFAGTLAAIGVAHHFDSDVRTHFAENLPGAARNSYDLQDAAPAVAMLVGTWGFSLVTSDQTAWHVSWNMLEALGLSTATDYALAYATGRERPYQTSDPNRWRAGGSSFPSEHVTAAFAIGTVLAESGNDRYRWVRRVLGYGVAGFTAYERLDHNAHWLSDTVAGAALGMASARFAMNRRLAAESVMSVGLAPLDHGVMVSATAHLP